MNKQKDLEKIHVSDSEVYCKLKTGFLSLSEEKFILKNNNYVLQSKSSKLEKGDLSKASTDSDDVIKKYDKFFHKFLARSLNKSVMASMIYGVSINETRGIGYDSDEESNSKKYDKLKTLHSYFVLSGK